MALLAEEIVEEWLNRRGYFTIRGAKTGVHEIDLLAVRPSSAGLECRHIEVQASTNPISWLTPATKKAQDLGTGRYSPKARSPDVLAECVDEWLDKKFFGDRKRDLRNRLAPGPWSFELVVHRVRHTEELDIIRARNVIVHNLQTVVREVLAPENLLAAAAGQSLIELIGLEGNHSASALKV